MSKKKKKKEERQQINRIMKNGKSKGKRIEVKEEKKRRKHCNRWKRKI